MNWRSPGRSNGSSLLTLNLHEQAMDRLDRFPHTILDICEEDVDILVGVVTNHRARTSVHTLFLCEQDFPGIINSEADPISVPPISVPLIPGFLPTVEYLGSEEGCCRLRREQAASFHLTEKSVQISGSSVCTAIGRPDGWVRIDIFLPGNNGTMLITQRMTSLGNILIDFVHAEEIRVEHVSRGEDLLTHIVPIGQTAGLFDEQAQQHIAAITVAASLARREIRGLVRKLGEKISGLDDRVVGSGLPDIRVHLPALFLNIIRDTRGMCQQMKDVDCTRDGCILQSQEIDD